MPDKNDQHYHVCIIQITTYDIVYTVLKAKFTVRTSLDSLLCMLLPDLTLYVNIRIPFQKFCHFFYLYLIAGSGDWGEGN